MTEHPKGSGRVPAEEERSQTGKADNIIQLVTAESVQLHGGIGMTDDFDLGLFMKEIRSTSELWGTVYSMHIASRH